MDGDPQRVVAGPDLDLHRSIRRTVLRGVVDEVHQHLLDPDRVDVREDALRSRRLDRDVVPRSLRVLARRGPHERDHVGRTPLQVETA